MSEAKTPPTTPSKMRPASDSEAMKKLKKNPEDEEAQLDEGLDETYPASDTPSETQPHSDKGDDKPAPSTSGGD